MDPANNSVCVTGAGGFVASWLIKLLLSRGYAVHGTLRNPAVDLDENQEHGMPNNSKAGSHCSDTGLFLYNVADDQKNGHLRNLENAAEKLRLFKADLLDYDSILASVKSCDGVFHVACPVPPSSVPNPEEELVKPSLDGTLNVLKACSEAKVKRAVVVSSISAVLLKPDLPKDREIDETCWSDGEFCKTTNNWYCYSKTVAEAEALEYGKRTGLHVITLCPGLIIGPMLQPTLNSSSLALVKLLREGFAEIDNRPRLAVDVRDVAEALKLVYEKPEAEGRYICVSHRAMVRDMVQILKETYPNYNYPKSFKEVNGTTRLSSKKLQSLGWKFRALKDTLVDSVENYKQAGILP